MCTTTTWSVVGYPRKDEMRRAKKKNIGSSFDDWLREEGLYEQTTAVAMKRVLARKSKLEDESATHSPSASASS